MTPHQIRVSDLVVAFHDKAFPVKSTDKASEAYYLKRLSTVFSALSSQQLKRAAILVERYNFADLRRTESVWHEFGFAKPGSTIPEQRKALELRKAKKDAPIHIPAGVTMAAFESVPTAYLFGGRVTDDVLYSIEKDIVDAVRWHNGPSYSASWLRGHVIEWIVTQGNPSSSYDDREWIGSHTELVCAHAVTLKQRGYVNRQLCNVLDSSHTALGDGAL